MMQELELRRDSEGPCAARPKSRAGCSSPPSKTRSSATGPDVCSVLITGSPALYRRGAVPHGQRDRNASVRRHSQSLSCSPKTTYSHISGIIHAGGSCCPESTAASQVQRKNAPDDVCVLKGTVILEKNCSTTIIRDPSSPWVYS